GEPDAGGDLVRQLGAVVRDQVEAELAADLHLLLHHRGLLRVDGVGDRVPTLEVDAVVGAELQQPVLTGTTALQVGRGDLFAVRLGDLGQLRTLQQAHLAGGVAGGDGTD